MTWQGTKKSPCLKFCSSDPIPLTTSLRDSLRFPLFLFVGRFPSKSDSSLKKLISLPTSSPHKTILFLHQQLFPRSLLCTVHRFAHVVVLFAWAAHLYLRTFWLGFKFGMHVTLLQVAFYDSMGGIASLLLNSSSVQYTELSLVMVCLLAPSSHFPSSQ